MQPLPIDPHLPEIVRALRERGALVLAAEPGAGKTTRVPPALVDAGLAGSARVVVLQPRRVAARAAARRVAAERGDVEGGFAGYRVRFDARTSAATKVEFVTEGLLVRALQADPELAGVGAVVLDEFHERSVHADLALALLAEVRRELRSDLRLVVMSATLECEPIAAFLGDARGPAPILVVPGRACPLTIEHVPDLGREPLERRVVAGVRKALARGRGDVLVFLPGVGEIRRARTALGELAKERSLAIEELYGEARAEDQDRVLAERAPGTPRRVVLATNVAETSLTVPGVDCVVDTGLARSLSHDPGRGVDRLELARISLASATQRAGRAGRLGPGFALRLWTPAEETGMRSRDVPEIRRVDLAGTALELAVWGVRDLAAFRWFEPPEPAALARAERLLVRLGALEPRTRAPTELGRALARVPAHPRLARLLHAAWSLGAAEDGALFAALLSERDVLRDSDLELATGPSDLLARRDLLAGRGAAELDRAAVRAVERAEEQLARAAARAFGRPPRRNTPPSEEELLHAIFSAFPDRVARRARSGASEGRMVGGTGVVLAAESAVREEELFVVLDAELGRRGERSRARVRLASAVRREWLAEIAGGALHVEQELRLDEERGRVVASARTLYEDLVLEEGAVEPAPEAAARLLAEAVRRDPLEALAPDASVRELCVRVGCLRSWMPELGLPALDLGTGEGLVAALEPLEAWCQGKQSLAELRELPLQDLLHARLGRAGQQALATHAPRLLLLPSGRERALAYEPGKPPVLAVQLQELFGTRTTPAVAAGRVPVLLHLLSPAKRVMQVTQDLASFWNNTYPEVRKELRARYPKHSWPEDPWTAPPTARPLRRKPR
jgi:ATP-dependent helicase HrpB